MKDKSQRLTHDQIRSVTNGQIRTERQCPVCGNWHLFLFAEDGFDCKSGCDVKMVAAKLRELAGIRGYKPPKATPPASCIGIGETKKLSGPLTVAGYAELKQLPEKYLREVWHLSDQVYTGVQAVAIPYSEKLTQYRGSGKVNQLFQAGTKTELYGLDKLKAPIENLFIVEGCSDTQTMHHAGFNVLGIPGLGSWKPEWSEQIRALNPQRVFLVQEPDDCNAEKWTYTKSDSWMKKITGKIRGVRLARKDASEVWLDAVCQSAITDGEIPAQSYFREMIQASLPVRAEKPAEKSDAEKPGRKLVLLSAAGYKMERIKWLWLYRVPLGEICLFCGVPGTGKSQAAIDLVSRISTGAAFCDCSNELGESKGAVILAGEDSITHTIIPRLHASGANLANVHFAAITEIKHDTPTRKTEMRISFEWDLAKLRNAVREHPEIKLVVIDPLDSYLGTKSKNKDADMRPLMDELNDFAAELEIAVVIVLHLNKSSEKAAIDRVAGAGAIVQAPRSEWIFLRDSEDETRKTRLMVPLKNNNTSEEKACTLKYQIASFSVPMDGEKPIESSRIEWLGKDENNRDADSVFEAQRNSEPKDSKLAACSDLIKRELSGGAKSAKLLHEATENAKFSDATHRRACQALRCKHTKLSDGWYISLPDQEKPLRGFNYADGNGQVSPIEESLFRPTIAPETKN